MPGPHKYNPIPFRPGILRGDPDGDREWLLAYAAETGRPVGAIVSEAVAEYRAKLDFARSVAARTANAEITGGLREARTPETTQCPGPPHVGHASSDWSCPLDARKSTTQAGETK